MSEVGFTERREARATGDSRRIGVGMLGYAFMGKAHSNALRTLAYMTWPPPLVPELVAIGGRSEEGGSEAARRYGVPRGGAERRGMGADPHIRGVHHPSPKHP